MKEFSKVDSIHSTVIFFAQNAICDYSGPREQTALDRQQVGEAVELCAGEADVNLAIGRITSGHANWGVSGASK